MVVAKMMAEINDWKDAPLWDPSSIEQVIKTWFKYMIKKGINVNQSF